MKITINSLCINGSESIDQIVNAIEDLVEKLASGLQIDTLEEIIVPEDFGEEIIRFQRLHDLKTGYTDNGLVRVVGKTISFPCEERIESVVFLDEELVASLFCDDIERQGMAINLVHHELCHAHDISIREGKFRDMEEQAFDHELQMALHVYADRYWSEYIACRMSASTLSKGHNFNIPFLLEIKEEIPLRVKRLIAAYRYDNDIDILYKKVLAESQFLMNMSCYTIGFLHGLGMDKSLAKLIDSIEPFQFKEILSDLSISLRGLYECYPNWSGIGQYDELCRVVLSAWNWLGIYPEETGSNTYIRVPF